ncbi:hypothetical protein [Bacillus swezeyi]|uniref:Uncharacterized protein n=1 Tax=Bacillus swezeyi TaxID=1925020 RepID=A0A5M8RHR9_9BACI|nr:hypothetical protein [Bacillus swezeyi]KAA6446998.1 hypothetical protein DX927_23435 [Bacillus swezeyi]KAA6471566.1 hypothetical protein DX928_23675 [Bacillus swezeyi]
MRGISIAGLPNVFRKVEEAVLKNTDVAVVVYSRKEFEDFHEVGDFVASTLKNMKCDLHHLKFKEKSVIKIYA